MWQSSTGADEPPRALDAEETADETVGAVTLAAGSPLVAAPPDS
jgi:hypothetical protein